MSFLFHFGDLLLDGKDPVDDSVDKIHRRCTIVFLLVLSIPLFTKQFAGEPIECFTPTYFTEAQSRYVNSYCWTVSTFYLDQPQPQQQQQQQQQQSQQQSQQLPNAVPTSSTGNNNNNNNGATEAKRTAYDTEYGSGRVHSIDYVDEYEIPASIQQQQPARRVQVKVSYYQWAPMILLVKAITFYVPFALWKALARRRGISLRQLMKKITRLNQLSPSHPDRPTVLREILEQVHVLVRGATRNNNTSSNNKPQPMSHWKLTLQQSRLFITFLLIKILYLLNDLLQFYLLVTFLGDDYLTHGWEIVRHLWTRRQWWTSPRFPLQTLCSVRAAQQGSLRLYQCHCVLPINLFNEKICSIWWFYIVALLPLTVTSLAIWCYRVCLASARFDFVEHYVLPSVDSEDDQVLRLGCRSFTQDYLGYDGVFFLHLIEINHGSTTLRTVVQELYTRSGYRAMAVNNPESNPSTAPVSSIASVIVPSYSPGSLRLQQQQQQQQQQGDDQPKINPSFSPGQPSAPRRLSLYSSRAGAPFQRIKSRLSLQQSPSTSVV